jgi:stress responsive alpha/beta barrel protein
MALRHVAWLRFKDGVSTERIEEHMAACRSLVGRVPVVQNLECGRNLSNRAEGFTHCIIVSLTDLDALPAYLDHPEHVPVAEALVTDVAELRVMDVEV